MEGTENIKKVIGFGLEVAADVAKAGSDGKIDWKDGYLIIDDIPKIPSLIKAVPKLKAEFMDLSNEEKEEILEFVRQKAVCKNEEAHGILEIAFQIVSDIVLLIDHVSDLSGYLKSLKAA